MSLSPNSCRICLIDKFESGKSFDEDENLLLLFEYCSGINVGDKIPRYLCENCITELHRFSNFKKKCVESDMYWETYQNNDEKVNFNEFIKYDTNEQNDFDTYNELNSETDVFDKPVLRDDTSNTEHIEYSKSCPPLRKRNKTKKKLGKIKVRKPEVVNASSTGNSFQCGLCRLQLMNDAELNIHLSSHWENKDLKCQICNYIGRDFADMLTHRYYHKPNKVYQCFICKSAKRSLLFLQFHFRHIHLSKPGGWCDICGKTFQIFKTWRRHMLFHKREKKLLVCDYCGKKYLYKYQIEEHIIHHLRKAQFVCETCGKGFKKKFNLKYHQRSIHSSSVPVKCGHCNKTYKNKESLDVHMKEVTRDKPYTCDLCSKCFSLPSSLKNHLFFHTGQKPFVCDVCGLKYKTKGSLKCHQLKHLGIFKHECTKCTRSFTTSVQLRRHLTVHTGIRKFKCIYCEKSFNEKYRLEAHVAKHKDVVKTES